MAFFKYGATVNIKKQASLDIIAKDVPEVSHTADKISAKKDDNFVYFWTRAVSADVPNLNSDLFPLDELKKAYPTFIGRGLYMDHNAQSVANAVGKVFDAKLLEDPTATEEEGRYYVGCLCGVDKTTHPDIAAKVAHGVIDSVSMGASCGSCQCNICNRVCHTPEEFCVHLQHQGQIDPETGKKCISINRDVNFSELSLVGVPADPMAKMQQVFAEFVGGLNKSASLEKEAENSFLEKFSFSIPCGNEKICETLFNVLTGYKKQGISDLSMDGSILKLSVEAKNEDLAKQKLEKISEEQGLGVEPPLEKEENLMPKEEIKPVEEQVEKKAGVFSQDVIQKCKELDEQYDDQENYVMFEIVDNNIKDYYKVPSELIYDQVSKPNMYIYLDGKLLTVKEYLEVSEGPVDDIKSESAKKENIEKKAGVVLSAKENDVKNRVGDFKYLATGEDVPAHRLLGDGTITRDDKEYFWEAVQQARKDGNGIELLKDGVITREDGELFNEMVNDAIEKDHAAADVLYHVLTREDGELYTKALNKVIETYGSDASYELIKDKLVTKEDGELYTKALIKAVEENGELLVENGILTNEEESYYFDLAYNQPDSKEPSQESEKLGENKEEKKAGIVPTEDVTLDNGTTYTVRYNPNEQSILSVMQDGKEVGIDGGTRLQILRKLFHKDEPTIVEENIEKKADSEQESSKTYTFDELSPEAKERVINEEGDSYMEWFWNDFQNDPSTYIKPELITKYNLDLDILELGADTPGGSIRTYGTAELKSGFLHNSFSNIIRPIVERVVKEAAKESKYVANHLEDYIDLGCGDMYWDSDYFAPYSGFSEIDDVPFSLSDDIAEALNDEAVPQIKKALEEIADNITEVIDSNEEYAYSEDNARDMSEANQYKYNEDGSFAKVSRFTRKLCVRKTAKSRLLKDRKPDDKNKLQEVQSSKTQSNEVKEVKAEENKETKKEDLVPGVSKEDTKKDIEHDLAKEKEEAKGGEDETKDIETLEKAIKETDKGALSKVINLLKKFIGGEAKEGEDLKDYKSDDLVKKLEEKPADKKASIEEPVNNVVNTVAEPVMDHIEAKPEVPAQPVPEVKEEVEEKKEEVKPSKDVKTKEDAVKVLEDVLKAGEEADVKELGKVLDFLKSDKKEEKKEEVKEEAKPLFANVTRVSLLKTANLIDSKWVFHFKGTDKVACLSVKNLLPGVSEKVAYLTSKEFYNEMMDTLTKKQAFDGEAVKQIVANYNEKIKVGSDEAKSQVSKATSKAKNETDGKKVSDTSKAVDTKLTDDGKAQKQDKVNSKEDAGSIESATKKAPAETDIKVSAELEAKCKQLTAALEAKEAEVSQMKMQQELAAKTAKARQIVEKSIKCGLVQCNETFRQEELLKQASPLKAKEEAMKRTADSMVADLLALSDEELDKQASYLSNFKVEAEVKQLKPIKIEASCEQSEDEDLIKALGAEMW